MEQITDGYENILATEHDRWRKWTIKQHGEL